MSDRLEEKIIELIDDYLQNGIRVDFPNVDDQHVAYKKDQFQHPLSALAEGVMRIADIYERRNNE